MRRRERIHTTLFGESLEVRQFAFAHPSADQRRIHSVESQDDEPLRELAWRTTAAEQRGLRQRNRHCDGNNGDERGDERSLAHVLGL